MCWSIIFLSFLERPMAKESMAVMMNEQTAISMSRSRPALKELYILYATKMLMPIVIAAGKKKDFIYALYLNMGKALFKNTNLNTWARIVHVVIDMTIQ